MASSSSEILPVRKGVKRSLPVTSDEESTENIGTYSIEDKDIEKWVWKNVENEPRIWKYVHVPGIEPIVCRRSGRHGK